MAFQFEPSVIVSTMPMLMRGVWYTIYLTIGGLFFGFILGVAAGLMKLSKRIFFRKAAGFYVELIRGTPMLVQAMFLYYGVPMAMGLRIPPLTAGIIVIAVNSGAYIAEIVRGAIQSINVGQTEAGRSIGLTGPQTMRKRASPGRVERTVWRPSAESSRRVCAKGCARCCQWLSEGNVLSWRGQFSIKKGGPQPETCAGSRPQTDVAPSESK